MARVDCLREEALTGVLGGEQQQPKIDATIIDRGQGVKGWGGYAIAVRLGGAKGEEI